MFSQIQEYPNFPIEEVQETQEKSLANVDQPLQSPERLIYLSSNLDSTIGIYTQRKTNQNFPKENLEDQGTSLQKH